MIRSFRVISISALLLLMGLTVPVYSGQKQQEDKPKDQERGHQQSKPADNQQSASRPARQDQQEGNKQQGQQRQQAPQAQPDSAKQQQQTRGQQGQQRQAQRQQQDNSVKQQQQQGAKTVRQDQPGRQQQQPQQQQSQNNRQRQQQPQQQINRSAQQRNPAQVRQQQTAWQSDRAHNWQADHRTWQQRGGYNGYRVPDARFRAYYGQEHRFRIDSLPVIFVGGNQRFQYGGFWFGLVDPWPEYWASNWYDDDDVYVDYYGDGYYLYNRRYPNDRIAISFYLN